MKLERGYLYHVYNRGNNGERIFYTQANYLFFIQKMDYHIYPFADILAWCLMPNHFHLMIYVQREKVFSTTINRSIGKMLSSYARAVNIQENRKGTLFQQHTKSIRLDGNETLSRNWYKNMGITVINAWNEEKNYPGICLNYIHQNPIRAGLVESSADWKWSSFREINGLNEAIELVNIEKLKSVVPL